MDFNEFSSTIPGSNKNKRNERQEHQIFMQGFQLFFPQTVNGMQK